MLAEISSRTLKSFFDTSPIPLTLASPVFDDCPVILCNDAFLDLTGYARDEVIGRNCRFLQGRNTDPVARRTMRASIENRSEALVQVTNYRKDGSEFENFVFMLPILDANGGLLYMLGSQCDITAPLRKLTPVEHAQMLEEGIELATPRLVARDHMRLLPRPPMVHAVRTRLTAELFE